LKLTVLKLDLSSLFVTSKTSKGGVSAPLFLFLSVFVGVVYAYLSW